MSFTFVPEYFFSKFSDATPEFLKDIGVRGIVLDVDNTLEPYENALPGEHVIEWLMSLKRCGISAAIVSNNDASRIDIFNSNIGLPAYSKAKKPFKKNVLNAMKDMGTDKETTVLMGDQVFTDVWAAHNAGIRAILVPPINDKKDFLTRFKRLLEKPIIKKCKKKQNKTKQNDK